MDTNIKVRESGPDILRSIAALFVICVHFYLNCGFYSVNLTSPKLFIMTTARWLFMIAVPLFVMLTGYCKSNKTISKAHYMSLVPLLIAYVVISIYKMLLVNCFYGNLYTLDFAIKNIANYQIAWYMGMYLSLMLIIPFLNKMWKACSGRKEHNILIASLVFISMLYPIALYIAPSYWQMLYPLAYYFAGTYIKEYRPKVKKIWLVLIIIAMILIEAIVSFKFANGGSFIWNVLGTADNGYSTFTVAVTAACIFLLFYDVNIKSAVLNKAFKSISQCSFEIYLFSACYDAIIFFYLKRYIDLGEPFFWWIFATVPTSFILGWISSIIYKFLYKNISGLVMKLIKRGKEAN